MIDDWRSFLIGGDGLLTAASALGGCTRGCGGVWEIFNFFSIYFFGIDEHGWMIVGFFLI